MRIFVTGGTGLIGSRLVRQLQERGDHAVVLTRRPSAARDKFAEGVEIVEGDPMKRGEWMKTIETCDGVINLAGANVFDKRWNEEFKQLMRASRLDTTKHVVEALLAKPTREDGQAKLLVNASAIGYYGSRGDEELDEHSTPGDDFLAELCIDWEKEAMEALGGGVRCAIVRVGVVLDKEGGALAKLLTPFKICVGGKVASGKQWMSWIHHDDIVGLFLHPLDRPDLTGSFNGTSPNPATNKAFSKALGKALGRPSFFPTPGFALRLALGEVARLVTEGQKVLPRRSQEVGYQYKFPDLDAALKDILSR